MVDKSRPNGVQDEPRKPRVVDSTFSGVAAIEEAPTQPRMPSASTSRAPPTPPNPSPVVKASLGSAFAPGVKAIIVQGKPRKKRKVVVARPVETSDEETDNDEPSSRSEPSSDDEMAAANGDIEDDEPWDGIPTDDEEQMANGDAAVDGDSASDSAHEDAAEPPAQVSRAKGSFRDWANQQILQAGALEEDSKPTASVEQPAVSSPMGAPPSASKVNAAQKAPSKVGPLGTTLDLADTPLLHQPTLNVPLSRHASISASRSLLPVVTEENSIMDLIRRHEVIVICGETGSGKTTQVPQFLFEAGWGDAKGDNPGMIGITQPRRVAAVSMAQRVEDEMGLKGKGVVGHQIRYDATTGDRTKIKFMTDGVLLRELAGDFLLSKYSAIVVDEAHERSVNTDVLIGVLSRVVKLRLKKWLAQKAAPPAADQPTIRPLRLIIMSATLRVADFTENRTLFPSPPPVISISARQHPVVVHFNRRTASDFIDEAYKKVSKIHARLPPGGILVFLTGQNEITTLCRKLEKRFGRRAVDERKKRQERLSNPSKALARSQTQDEKLGDDDSGAGRPLNLNASLADIEVDDLELGKESDLAKDVDDGEVPEDPEALDTDDEDDLIIEGVVNEEDSLGEYLFLYRRVRSDAASTVPMHILPLYSLLPTDQQMRVFKAPPGDSRLVVVATNVAETSLTIPNIKYVVDAGRAKERRYDLATGVQDFQVSWISKASASQRAGRAGRTGPGHCYRLYSSAVFENHFEQFSKPEILRMPIEGIVLQMKAMNIDTVINFPFPTPPDRFSLQKAETALVHLGALSAVDEHTKLGARITDFGRAMASYPLSPRLARMLVSGNQHGCLPYVIALVSIFSVGDPFLRDDAIGADESGDAISGLDATELGMIKSDDVREKEARKLQRRAYFQVQTKYAAIGGSTSDVFKALGVVGAFEYEKGGAKFCRDNFVRPKAMEEIHKLRAQISRIVESVSGVDAGFSPALQPPSADQSKVLRQLLTAAFVDQIAVRKDLVDKKSGLPKDVIGRNTAYRVMGLADDVFIHPASIHYLQTAPEFIVYQELHRTSRVWLKGITKSNGSWLPILAKSLCTFSKPVEDPAGGTAGAARGKLRASDTERECYVVPKFGGPTLDVALPIIKVTQKRVGSRWVFD